MKLRALLAACKSRKLIWMIFAVDFTEEGSLTLQLLKERRALAPLPINLEVLSCKLCLLATDADSHIVML